MITAMPSHCVLPTMNPTYDYSLDLHSQTLIDSSVALLAKTDTTSNTYRWQNYDLSFLFASLLVLLSILHVLT